MFKKLWRWFFPAKPPAPNCRIVRCGDSYYPQRLMPEYYRIGLKGGDLVWMCFTTYPYEHWDKGEAGKYPSLQKHFPSYELASDWFFKHLAKEEYDTPAIVAEFHVKKPKAP